MVQSSTANTQRNAPCPCGSGKKYKKCCAATDAVDVRSLFTRALRHFEAQQYEESETLCRQAIAHDAQFSDGYQLLALTLSRRQQHEEAIAQFTQAITLSPHKAVLHWHLGSALNACGRVDEALTSYAQAVRLKPDDVKALTDLVNMLRQLGRQADGDQLVCEMYRELERQFQQQQIAKDAMVAALGNYAVLCAQLGLLNDAEAICRRAVQLDAAAVTALNTLGCMLMEKNRYDDAISVFQQALAIDPHNTINRENLGRLLRMQGRFNEAVDAYYAVAMADKRTAAAQMTKIGLMLPLIPQSSQDIHAHRQRIVVSLDGLTEMGVRLSDPYNEVGFTQFELAYHGINDRPLQERIAQFYSTACPDLVWTAPHCRQPVPREGRRIRLGIASAFLRNHTIGKFMLGIIEHVSREQFELVIINASVKRDAMSEKMKALADRTLQLPDDFWAARDMIAAQELDILFYPDIGMQPFTYFMAYQRLAPVQCVTWGHPVTTGIPAMDYFLSARDLEPEGADDHYSERLIRFDHLPTYYYRPAPTTTARDRADFGLPAQARIYLCPQSLFKLHPDFDTALASLLHADPMGMLVLTSGGQESLVKLLQERFARSIPDVVHRIIFLPLIGHDDYLHLLTLADAVIDPPYFGGGNTSYETFAMGVPIVTWPGPFMRGRVTDACYRKIGMTDLVAQDADSYIQLALRLANDREWRDAMSARILERCPVLYEEMGAVRELEQFFHCALDAADRGERLTSWEGIDGHC